MTAKKLNDRQAADARFIRETAHWPKWPILPMIRRKESGNEHGMITDDSLGFVVHMATANGGVKHLQYRSVADMLLDGWEVD